MKRHFIFGIILFAMATAASFTVTREGGISVKASSDWKVQDVIANVPKGTTGDIIGQFDDWVSVKVINSKIKELNGKTGFVWVPAVKDGIIGAGEKGKSGAGLHDLPGNDVSGKRVQVKDLGLLWPGDKVEVIGYSRPTWFLVKFTAQKKWGENALEDFTGQGWVYAPYGIVK